LQEEDDIKLVGNSWKAVGKHHEGSWKTTVSRVGRQSMRVGNTYMLAGRLVVGNRLTELVRRKAVGRR
jgi:hypothetical protein